MNNDAVNAAAMELDGAGLLPAEQDKMEGKRGDGHIRKTDKITSPTTVQ